jgi:DNA polymerase
LEEESLMVDPSQLSEEDWARQARQHLDSLRRAGVEWLPKGPPLNALPAATTPTTAAASDSAPSLFAEVTGAAPAADVPDKGEDTAGATSSLTLPQRRQELALLAEKVAGCTRCQELAATRTQTVFADGELGAELCFIGEAPGADEDAQGLPFVGAAGQLLNRIIAACGMKREEVYICNILKCRPPGNRTPYPYEAANCREYLEQQLELLKPKYICCLGGTAAQHLLGTTAPMGKLRGKFHDYKGIPVMCTYHPAYLLPHRNPAKKKDVWEDMKMLMARMGRPVK